MHNESLDELAIISVRISSKFIFLKMFDPVEITIKFSNDLSDKVDRNRVFVAFILEKSRSHFTSVDGSMAMYLIFIQPGDTPIFCRAFLS